MDDGGVHLSIDSSKGQPPSAIREDGFSFSATKHGMTSKRLERIQRALLKCAFELAWVDLGPSTVLGSSLDHVRDRILNGGHRGYLAFPKRTVPNTSIRIQYNYPTEMPGRPPFAFVSAWFWGVHLITDSINPAPLRALGPDWGVLKFPF